MHVSACRPRLRFRLPPLPRLRARVGAGLLVPLLLASSYAGALAASGDLDPSFGDEGAAVAPFGGSIAFTLARQTDGKLVAAGTTSGSANNAIAVARFDADGALDPTFGGDGLVTTDIGAFSDVAVQVLVQSDGKIVVVADSSTVADNSDSDIAVVRYQTDGTLDPGFGTGGIKVLSLGTATDTPHAGALQTDDKVIVVGGLTSTMTTSADLFVLRLDTSGNLDGGFGTGGVATLDFGGRGDSGAAVAVQTDGMIVIAGESFDGPLYLDGAVATLSRLDAAGVPDPGFGTGGSVVEAIDTINIFKALAIQPDGKIAVLGATGPLNVGFRLFRYDDTGVPDPGLAPDPIPVFPQSDTPQALALQPDGKFIVIGNGLSPHFTIARMNDDGSLDTSFGIGGSIQLAVGVFGNAFAALPAAGGKILLAGVATPAGGSFQDVELTLARVDGDSPACATDADCGVCERCGGGGVCEIGERSGCTDAAPGDALLKFRQRYGKGDRLKLIWRGAVPSFDPTTSDDVGICLYENGVRLLKAVAPAGGTCAGSPCWSSPATSEFEYEDPDLTPHGIQRIRIESDKILLTARGEELASSPQGLPDPLSVGATGPALLLQVHAGNGACVEATFDSGRRVRPNKFSSKND
jgi:uncharacterized delta-60 repeat protein